MSIAAVHTTGINWDSIAVIGSFILALMVFFYGLMEKRSKSIKNDITAAVNNLETVLTAKLETKDAVTELRIATEKQMADLRADLRILQASADTQERIGQNAIRNKAER